MSTDYLTKDPMSVEAFRSTLAAAAIPFPGDEEELTCADGKIRVLWTRYGRQDPTDILEEIEHISEYEEEFENLMDYEDD